MNLPTQMLGLCRFSFLFQETTGFAKKISTGEGGYDEARIEARLKLFEALTLPSLAAQTDKDFKLIILVGRHLPQRFKAQLAELTDGIPQFVLHEEEEGQHHLKLCKAVLLAHRDPGAPIVGDFRMDDDDAVAIDFIETARAYASAFEPIIAAGRTVELDFCRGLALNFTEGEVAAKEIIAGHWTPAQVFFNLASSRRTAFHHHHFKSWQQEICVSVPSPVMFVRGLHSSNDSGRAWEKLQGQEPDPVTWQSRFGFDLAGMLAGQLDLNP